MSYVIEISQMTTTSQEHYNMRDIVELRNISDRPHSHGAYRGRRLAEDMNYARKRELKDDAGLCRAERSNL
jgi:hypothetical protein